MIRGGIANKVLCAIGVGAIGLSGVLTGCARDAYIATGDTGKATYEVHAVGVAGFEGPQGCRLDFYDAQHRLSKVVYDDGSGVLGDSDDDYLAYKTVDGWVRFTRTCYLNVEGKGITFADKGHRGRIIARYGAVNTGLYEEAMRHFRDEGRIYKSITSSLGKAIAAEHSLRAPE